MEDRACITDRRSNASRSMCSAATGHVAFSDEALSRSRHRGRISPSVVSEGSSDHNGGHMPWLLARSILIDLLRVGGVITIVLVTVIAFGATLKPLAREDLITVGQAVRYVALAMVPMLQFALPFAAGFAGTLTMHRMASENELVAAAASGISYPRLLAPIAGLGLALLLVMLVLTQDVIPRFLARLAEVLQRDVALLFQASVGRGEALRVGDLQIWADELTVVPTDLSGLASAGSSSTPGEGSRLILFRVAVANLDSDGRVIADLTAERITVDISRDEEGTLLDLDLADAVVYKPSDGMLAWIERPDSTAIRLPNIGDAHVRSMTGRQLRALRERPETYPSVQGAFRALAEAVQEQELAARLGEHLAESGVLLLTSAVRPQHVFELRAEDFDGGAFLASGSAPVTILERDRGVLVRQYRAAAPRLRPFTDTGLRTVTAGLTMGSTAGVPDGRFELILEDCQWIDEEVPGVVNQRAMIRLENLELPGGLGDPVSSESVSALRARAEAFGGADRSGLPQLVRRLDQQILRLERRIDSRIARRHAVSATAPLMLMTGCVLAMLLRRRTPLVIYTIAFLPAILSIILISSGDHLMRDGRVAVGWVVMWSGNVGTAIIGLIAFLRLRRN